MTTRRLYQSLVLLALAVPNSVHASCEILSKNLNRIHTEEQASFKKARKEHVQRKCGRESQSWIGGAAGRRRFEYLNCRLSARNSTEFKRIWAVDAVFWNGQKETIKTDLVSSGCLE